MKKIALFAFTVIFAAAFGVAYAGEVSNGITNFTGKYINSRADLDSIDSSAMPSAVEGSNPGGLRSADLGIEEMNNGATNFSGLTYDTGAAVSGVIHGAIVKSAPYRAVVPDFSKPLTN